MISNERADDELRPVTIRRGFASAAPGSVLFEAGRTVVLCTASIDPGVPPWIDPASGRGWVTAEYAMSPGSTRPRKRRDRDGKLDGRTAEIQRLIGRSLRAVVDLSALGPRTITLDCDVLVADGGTRTASVTGALVALVEALRAVRGELPQPDAAVLTDTVAAVSVGIVAGRARLDLHYALDVAAEVDLNVVRTGAGRFVELQGTGEEATFDDGQLAELLTLAKRGCAELTALQREALGPGWPLPPS